MTLIASHLLSLIIFMPLLGAAVICLGVRGDEAHTKIPARVLALLTTLAGFALSLLLLQDFAPNAAGYQFIERVEWLPQFGINYFIGIDGISLWFVLLSTFLTPLCVLSTFSGITKRTKECMIALLVLETTMLGMFCALDFVLFYVFFEAVLIPMFLIIGIWGGQGRIYAAFKFFLYTFTGSVLMLIAIITMVLHAGTADMTLMAAKGIPAGMGHWLWLAFFVAFAVKTPMWPFHTWLPYAHVEAPTAGSVILAGVLLKMGGYSLIRVNLQMLPEASTYFLPLVLALSVIAIIYTSLVALVQTDLKKLVAYSSVAHMGYVTLGIFVGNQQGLEGAMYVMLSHTLVSAAMFLCVGVVYDRLHTRDISRYGALAKTMPRYAAIFMVFMLASIGLPGTSGFVGEFLSMQGAFLYDGRVAALAGLGTVLGAAYILWLYRRLFYGATAPADAAAMPDISKRELVIFLPLLVLVIWLGLYPASVKQLMAPRIAQIIEQTEDQHETVTP
jgi:NADH-quinone oxidoreductase subunit M